MARILVVDDESNILQTLESALSRRDHNVVTADSFDQGKAQTSRSFDIIFLDVMLPDGSGLDLLKLFRAEEPQRPVVMISGHADVEMAVKAIREGAWDFIEKPLSLDRVLITIDNAVRMVNLQEQRERLAGRVWPDFVGDSPAIEKLRREVSQSAEKAQRFLITGENGTGKELVAHMIHSRSRYAEGPFVAVNCAALPSELIESELFGHTAGAFTGAGKARKGYFVEADRGTIFLDEIGEMPAPAQAKILRVIETRQITPLGAEAPIGVQGNIVAASNRDLQQEVEAGRFRLDLLYRLNVVQFHLPPLRERPEDIPLLLDHFLEQFAVDTKSRPKRLTADALRLLSNYSFPGNVRELKNLAERISIYAPGETVDLIDLKPFLPDDESGIRTLRDATDDFQRRFIRATIRRHDGNITRAARELGLERSHLYKKIKKLGLKV
jgi:two-component system nitrogen regulation response regulator NtrX